MANSATNATRKNINSIADTHDMSITGALIERLMSATNSSIALGKLSSCCWIVGVKFSITDTISVKIPCKSANATNVIIPSAKTSSATCTFAINDIADTGNVSIATCALATKDDIAAGKVSIATCTFAINPNVESANASIATCTFAERASVVLIDDTKS